MCRLIVCEKTSRWAASLRDALPGQQPRIVETRSLAACEAELEQSPTSLVAVEATIANVESVVEFVVRAGRRFPHCALVALLSFDALEAAPVLQEAGVIAVASSVLEAPRLARLAHRQHARWPQPEPSLRELVLQRMPWPTHAAR